MTFRQFKKGYMDMLNKKTTLIIIGDGRTNYGNPEESILDEMRVKLSVCHDGKKRSLIDAPGW